MNRRQFVVGTVCLPPFLRAHLSAVAQNANRSWLGTAAPGQVVNLAQCGELKSWLNPGSIAGHVGEQANLRLAPPGAGSAQADFGFEWPEFRTVQEVLLRFGANPPDPGKVYLEFWDGLTALQGSWKPFEDGLTNGNHLKNQGGELRYRFQQRRTCKVRLRFDRAKPTDIEAFAIHGPSVWKSGDLRIDWGHAQQAPWEGHLEAYNGKIVSIRQSGSARLTGENGWQSEPGAISGLVVSLLYTTGMDVDRSILTVRSSGGDCSFLPGEAIDQEPIDIIDHGIYVRKEGEPLDQAGYRARNAHRARVIDEVARQPEQSIEEAFSHIKARRVTLSFVGSEANNQKFGISPDGHVVVSHGDPLSGDPMTPQFAVYFDSAEQPFLFQNPPQPAVFAEDRATPWVTPKEQRLVDGWLPMIETRWSQNNLAFERTDFGTLLETGQSTAKALVGNEPAIMVSRLRIVNNSPTSELATWYIRPWKPADLARFPYGAMPQGVPEAWTTISKDDLVGAVSDGAEILVCHVDSHQKGELSLDPSHNAVRYQLRLEPGEEHTIHCVLPGWEPRLDQASLLQGLDYDGLERAAAQHWKDRAAQSMQIQIPDEHLQNLFNASMQHFLLGLTRNGKVDQYFPNVAMLYYGSIGSESSPIIRALDMRGLHHHAERCLEAFLASQGEFMPAGDYQSKEGGFYRFWPIYTVDQGGVLWAAADHYRFTRDKAWLQRVAAQVIAGCEFIVRERKRTMAPGSDGARPLYYGLAPAGCVADPRDWQYSFMLNAWFYAGLKNCADILADIDEPKAKALQAEAADYKQCILRACRDSVAVSPVTRLRDNTSVPSVPSYLGLRGFSTDVKDSVDPDRRHGYAYDCTIGPFHLFNCGVLEPDDPLVTSMLNYFEDRFFLFTPLPSRVNLDHLATDWFNLGGFEKLQPYYVHYQEAYLRRDQIPNFIRGFYNTLASISDQDTLTFQEELDFGGGQPHKTHEEAWFFHQLRHMLLMESGTELHIAQGTPRRWLTAGQTIRVRDAPTWFGRTTYQICAASDSQAITAEVEIAAERAPSRILLRLRHPNRKPIRTVSVNGEPWRKFDIEKEWIELPPNFPKITVRANY